MDDFLCIDAHDLEHLGPIFSDLPQISKNTNTCITKLSVGLYPLMQNVEFNTMDEFVYPCPLFGFFPWLAPIPKYNKTGVITRPSDGLTLVSFSIKSWVKHLQWLFMYSLPLYVLSHELPQIPSSVYKFLLELPLGLNRAWANLIRNLSWRMLITFFASLIMINLGHWVHNYSEPQKILVFLFGFSSWRTRQTWRFQKHGRVQKINLYLCTSSVLPLHQIKNSCKLNLFFTHQINNLD